MPPTPRSVKVVAFDIDHRKLTELTRLKRDLSIRGHKKFWEQIAEELKAPVDTVKKAWSKMQEEEAEQKMMESTFRRSLKTNIFDTRKDIKKSVEPSRRSLRSNSIDKSTTTGPSSENSCASSTCSSPKTEDKRSLRSRSQLSAITEAELISMAGGDATIIGLDDLKDLNQDLNHDLNQDQNQDQNQDLDEDQEDEPTLVFEISNQETVFSEQYASDSTERGLQDLGMEGIHRSELRSRFLEPARSSSKKMTQTPLNDSPRRFNHNKNNKSKRSPNPSDSTRTFFDSMALTVATFPQHLQAQVKVQVCKIISQTEYNLSLPKAR